MDLKLAFSTLGCPDWSFGEMFSTAADLGYNGIEIRGIADEIYAPKITVFSPEELPGTKATLARTGLSIPILTSGAYLAGNENIAGAEFEVKDYIMLAAALGVKYVRVLGEKSPEPVCDCEYGLVLEKYRALCDFAKNYNVGLLIETNGFLADTKRMKAFMEQTGRENAGVIWDIHHPYRFFGETPQQSVENIGSYIKHVHIKDSVKGSNGKITYMLSGYGDVPVAGAVKALREIGFDGYYSYEWVKRWSRELAEPGIAFYQYISYMREL